MEEYSKSPIMKHETISFSFGENWLKFGKNLDEKGCQEARQSLSGLLETQSLEGKTFLDIGCGSGIFSLAAVELKAKRVFSMDVDPKSISACKQMKKKCEVENWEIVEGSILDKNFFQTLGTFDVVYSWGVLHHTGAMWEAIDNAANLVSRNGLLAIAVYNRTRTSNFWLRFKRLYNSSGKFVRSVLVWLIFLPRVMVRLMKLKHPLKEKRGMSVYYDAIDWAGGLPYEFASFQEVCSFLNEKQFKLINSRRTMSTGCNEFVFERKI